jgi:hypothetical protein
VDCSFLTTIPCVGIEHADSEKWVDDSNSTAKVNPSQVPAQGGLITRMIIVLYDIPAVACAL